MPTSDSADSERASVDGEVFGAIPARYASTRLPGKPLATLAGRTLIEHVYRRAADAKELKRVVVLTDDERIYDAVAAFGGAVEMTPGSCVSGTDRVAVAAQSWDAAAIVNIQGDEPLIEPAAIDLIARHLKDHPEDEVTTLAAPAQPSAREDPDVVKVVVDLADRALYFSRSAIPFARGGTPVETLHHIGIYGYQRSALLRLAGLEPTPLERSESLEQLRALENGIAIRVLRVSQAWQGVDTMADLKQVEGILGELDERTPEG